MTWTQIDDGLNFSPQTMPGTVSNAALGLWVRLCVHTAYQLRFPAFDGAFDLTVVRSLSNARRVAGWRPRECSNRRSPPAGGWWSRPTP